MCLCPLSLTLLPYTTLFRSQYSSRPLPCGARSSRPTGYSCRRQGGQCESRPPHDGCFRGERARTPREERCCNDSPAQTRSEEHTSELQSRGHLVCRLLLEKK